MADDTDFPATAPATPTAPPVPETGGDHDAEINRGLLDRMARSEDASDYISERQDQEREELEGETVATQDRAERVRAALEEARKDTNDARQPNGLDDQIAQAAAALEQQQAWEQQNQERESDARAQGQFYAHTQMLSKQNPEAYRQIYDAVSTFDALSPSDAHTEAFTKGSAAAIRLKDSHSPIVSVSQAPT